MEFQVIYLTLFLLFSVIDSFEWFRMESLHNNIQLMLEFLKALFLLLHFSCYTLMTFLMMFSVILLFMLMILLSIISDQASDLWQQLELASKLESVPWSGFIELVSFDWFNNTESIDVKMDGSALDEKSSFKMLGLTVSSKLDWGSYIISIAKTASKKIGTLIRSMKFLSPEVALYLYKSTICPCMEYCCHVWAGAPSCHLELLDKLQKKYAGLLVLQLLLLLKP